jgi:hypothetical protein
MDSQLLWLQRDFDIFTVNIFDFNEIVNNERMLTDPCSMFE